MNMISGPKIVNGSRVQPLPKIDSEGQSNPHLSLRPVPATTTSTNHLQSLVSMPRTKQSAPMSTGGKARKQLELAVP